MVWKCCTQYASKFGKFNSGHGTGKVFIPILKNGNVKVCSNYHTIALISHASKAMLKILQARLQQYMNQELPDVQAGFRKGRGTRRSNCQHLLDHRRSKSSRKTSTSGLLTTPKPLTVWITTNCGKFLKEKGMPDYLICLLRNPYAGQEATVRTRHGTMNWFQIENQYIRIVYCHLLI